jgi:hypothetical protein
MRPRNFASLILCVAVLTVSSLGVNRGMVLHVDDGGHLVLEHAHVRHAHEHEEGADHEPHERPADADHDDLHAAMGSCSDAGVAKGDHRSGSSAVSGLLDIAPLPHPIASSTLLATLTRRHQTRTSDFWGDAAHPELAALRLVVLLV